MKRYKKEPIEVVRVMIKQANEQALYLTLSDCTLAQAYDNLKALLEKHKVSPLVQGKRTQITVREAKGASYGKSKTFTIAGMSTEAVYNLLEKKIPEQV